MRTSMGNMIGDHASDVHQILGKNMDGPTDFNNLTIERGDLTRLMRRVAEDPKAFGVMHHSQSVVIAEGQPVFCGRAGPGNRSGTDSGLRSLSTRAGWCCVRGATLR
ncbi:hypothetical protein [Streptomyces sp. NPDC092307]|uniref:hypothetical protein n=1 Tax=Streptomyces sp. NPDC092307 TaxID=3366013 RepID=UPI0037F186E8